jgi:hypothetical protein
MKRNEADYLQALKSFSAPARRLWDVTMVDDENFDFTFRGDASIYRYWDATHCVEFGLRMAAQSLDVDLRQETGYLQQYDEVARRINARIDLNSNALSLLVRLCLQNAGHLSTAKRKGFLAKGYREETLNMVEAIATSVMTGQDEEADEFSKIPPFQA